ncbi:MAG: MBL fold metallo-hydrolase, partial [Actinomycetota bacterium]|nr:MBL fold metallo-hydrolase [Actinomycetota bacterium]
MKLTVLGCSGSYPGPGAACSGYLMQGGGVAVWVDAGSGTLANLQRHVDLDELDAVVLSHAHPDHWTDLLSFQVYVSHIRPRTGVPVFSPAEVRRLTGEIHGDPAPHLEWQVVADGSTARVGGLSFTFSRTDHPVETLAMRIDAADGSSLGYSADTGPGWSLSALGPDLDLALCEATLAPERAGAIQHLTAAQAGESARAAGARR